MSADGLRLDDVNGGKALACKPALEEGAAHPPGADEESATFGLTGLRLHGPSVQRPDRRWPLL